jgi:hypothetical protein
MAQDSLQGTDQWAYFFRNLEISKVMTGLNDIGTLFFGIPFSSAYQKHGNWPRYARLQLHAIYLYLCTLD